MKSTTEKLLITMNILTWIVCIGILVKAGAIIISYVVSIGNPQAAKDLYRGMDLSAYRHQSFWDYTFLVGCKVILYITQAYIAFLITRLLSRLNISRPFSADAAVAKLMRNISYSIAGAWLVAMVYNIHTGILERVMGLLQHT